MEGLQRELARVRDDNKILKEKAKIAKSQLNKERDEKVLGEYLHIDASKSKSLSSDLSSDLLSKFGRGEKPVKDVGTKPKTLQKSDKNLGSPAKRFRDDTSRSEPADHQTLPSSKEADQSKMHHRQGSQSGGKNSTYTEPKSKSYHLHPKENLSKSKFNGPPP